MSQTSNTSSRLDIQVSIITDTSDLGACHDILTACFGRQNPDAIYAAFHPMSHTPEGRERAVNRLIDRFGKTTYDRDGQPNTIYIKATVPFSSSDKDGATSRPSSDGSTSTDGRKIVAYAIWCQMSYVEGHGDGPKNDFLATMGLETLYPDNVKMRHFIAQFITALTRKRYEVVRSKVHATPCAVMGLDLCVVDPEFQGRGVGNRLVQWGLDEAKRRGDLECVLEASKMGRGLYKKMGFVQVGGEIPYDDVEDKNAVEGLELPPNVFMRTQPTAEEVEESKKV